MKSLTLIGLVAALALAGCRSNAEPVSSANAVEACELKTTDEERRACMKDVVDTVALSLKREQERRKAAPR